MHSTEPVKDKILKRNTCSPRTDWIYSFNSCAQPTRFGLKLLRKVAVVNWGFPQNKLTESFASHAGIASVKNFTPS